MHAIIDRQILKILVFKSFYDGACNLDPVSCDNCNSCCLDISSDYFWPVTHVFPAKPNFNLSHACISSRARFWPIYLCVFPAELDFDLCTCVYFQPSLNLTNHLCVFSAQLDDAGPGWLPASPTAGQQDARIREGRVPAEEEWGHAQEDVAETQVCHQGRHYAHQPLWRK